MRDIIPQAVSTQYNTQKYCKIHEIFNEVKKTAALKHLTSL